MNRRDFIMCTVATLVAPRITMAADGETLDYVPGLIAEKLQAGETVLVDFAADWCSTCKRQERIISELREADPTLDEHITFIRVDWDEYGSSDVATSRNVPRRSTLLLLKGNEELGRIIAGTQPTEIQALLNRGVPG